MASTLPIAPNGVFRTVHGEGALMGVPMTFIRTAGCSIGCRLCDTDYSVKERVTIHYLVDRVKNYTPKNGYVWITGGEPTDHDLVYDLIDQLKVSGFLVALATSGNKLVKRIGIDFLSVSPHNPLTWVQRSGEELKIVPYLNGYSIQDLISDANLDFTHKYISPCYGVKQSVVDCFNFIENNPGWKMTCQAHKLWGMP